MAEVTVTREHLAGLELAISHLYGHIAPENAKALDKLIAQASAAPEPEPVGYTTRGMLAIAKDSEAPHSRFGARTDRSDRFCVPLYTHADPSEVERLRAELKAWMNAEAEKGIELVQLRQKLAEAQALLRECARYATRMEPMTASCLNRIDELISATTQPAEVKS